MTSAYDELAAKIYQLEQEVKRLGSSSQLGNSTVGDADAVPVASVVAEAAVTNDALPTVQDDVAESSEGVSDLTSMYLEFNDDLDARFEQANAELDDARAELEDSQEDIRDAFGQQFDGMSADIQTAITAAGNAQSAADGKPLILFSSVRGPSDQSDLAPTGSTWFFIDASKNIAGQWQQTGPAATPSWTPRQLTSEVFANLDVGKLTAGQAAIADLVAQKIAASTANFQTVNAANLFVTDGATMNQATINYLFANVVQAKKITADMLDVNSLNGVTLTGTLIKSAASGKRLELLSTRLDVYDETNTRVGRMEGVGGYFQFTTPTGMVTFGAGSSPVGPGVVSADSVRGNNSVASQAFIINGVTIADSVLEGQTDPHSGTRLTVNHLRDASDASYFYEGRRTAGRNNRSRLTADDVQAGDFRLTNGTSILPVAGSPISPRSGWTIAATRMWVENGYAYIQFAANKSSVLAAGASEAVCDVPAAFVPAAGQYLVPGACYGSTSPAPGLLQISATGTITVFNFGGNHNSFSGIFAHPV